jgi:molybdate/tungstate transport system permease protein
MLTFALALLYPLAGLGAHVGPWQWDGIVPGSTSWAAWNSLFLTAIALVIDVVLGTPVAYYLARSASRERLVWEAVVLISVLMPPLALGILLSLAFGPQTALGAWLLRVGVPTSNSSIAFVATQVYASIGYYILAGRAALAAVPLEFESIAALLGSPPCRFFAASPFHWRSSVWRLQLALRGYEHSENSAPSWSLPTIQPACRCRSGSTFRTLACRR